MTWGRNLTGAEEVADDVHAVHEGTLDDLQRGLVVAVGAALLGVGDAELVDALDERVLEALADGLVAPRLGVILLGSAGATLGTLLPERGGLGLGIKGGGELEHALGSVGAPVQEDVLTYSRSSLSIFS